MPKHRLYLGIAGLLFLLASIGLLVVASSTQTRMIDYGTVAYDSAGEWPSNRLSDFIPGWLTTIVVTFLLLAIGRELVLNRVLMAERPSREKPLWSRLIPLAGIALFAGALVAYLLIDRPSQSVQYGQPPTPGQPSGYMAFAELSGPTRVRFGDSTEIAFTVWISQGLVSAPISNLVLAPNESYTATAILQAVNFDVDESSRTAQSNQPLSAARSAFWSWVVSPKEKRLGRQTLVVRANVQDAQGNLLGGDPYLKAEVSVTDPIGLPGPVYYILIGVGGVVSLPLWAWLYKEWDARRKERRDEKIKELEKEVRDLKARKWWQFWKW